MSRPGTSQCGLLGTGAPGQGLDLRFLESFPTLSGSVMSVTVGHCTVPSPLRDPGCKDPGFTTPASSRVWPAPFPCSGECPQPQGCSVFTHVAPGRDPGAGQHFSVILDQTPGAIKLQILGLPLKHHQHMEPETSLISAAFGPKLM